MSLSMSDAARFLALELRVAELEKQMPRCCQGDIPLGKCTLYPGCEEMPSPAKRRGRPPKNLEERMKAQEHDPIDAE